MLRKGLCLLLLAAAPGALAAQSSARWSTVGAPEEPSRIAEETRQAILFGARESVQQMDLSPDGTKVAFIGPGPGRSTIGYVVDLSRPDAQPQVVARSDGNPSRLRWCKFASDERLVCRMGGIAKEVGGGLMPFARLLVVAADGSGGAELISSLSRGRRFVQFDGDLVDWLPDDPGAVLVGRGGQVERIDLLSRRGTPVQSNLSGGAGYMIDGQGNIRIRYLGSVRGATFQAGTRTSFYYRPGASGDWRPLGTFDSANREGLVPLAVDGELNAAYLLKKLDGRLALHRVKLDGSMATELVHASDRVDVDDVVRLGRSGRVIGVTFAEEKRRIIYFDPELGQLAADLGKAIPNLPIIDFQGSSRDGSKLLIHAGADNDPGRYFIYERGSRKLTEIMLVRPDLENVRLAAVRPVSYPAADGTLIPAYLTLPPGREARGLPAVVLPHGGPSARDEWGFDWLAQYLAGQGYAVLQPNYRGSAGFGDAWLQRNGFQGWRTSIGDIADGARWLAAEGVAAPDRIAVVGWSYGGYAALQAAASEPGLFKAVAAIAPVTDLQQLKDDWRDFTSFRNTAEFIGSGPHIREGSPLQNAARIQVPVLLFHGDRDLNVLVSHSQRMDRALRSAGRQSELQVYEGAEHDLGDATVRAHMLNRIAQLLRRTIGR
jgi:dienelactone hydrolase